MSFYLSHRFLTIKTATVIFLLSCFSGCSTYGTKSDNYLSKFGSPTSGMLEGEAKTESEAFYNYLVGELAFGEQDFETAQKSFAKASELIAQPSASVHEKLAEMYVRSGNIPQALLESNKLLEAEPNNIEYQLLHAGILESAGHLPEAVELYEKLIKQAPERIELFVLLANTFVKAQNLERAELALKRGEKQDPQHLLILYNLGRISEARKDNEQALAYYLKTFEQDPQNGIVVPDIVRVYLVKERFDELESFAQRVLEHQPQNVVARKLLSQLLLGKSKLNEALEQFQVLEDMQERIGPDTRLKISKMHINSQNFPEAIRQLLLVLAEEPGNDEARFFLASIYASTGRITDSFTELQKIKPGSEHYAKAKVFEGFLWRQEGDSAKAEKSFLEIHNTQPQDLKILYYLITVLKEQKKLDLAEKYFLKALAIKPKSERLIFQYAVLLHDMGKSVAALERMQEVIKLNPKNADALNFVAFALAEQGQELDRALTMVEKALKLTPNEPYYLDTKGWIYYKLEDFEQAKKYIAQSLEQLPNDPEINEHYADVLIKLSQLKLSREHLKKVLEILAAQEKTESDIELRQRVEQKINMLEKKLETHQ